MRSAVALLAVSLVACGALLGSDEDDDGGSSSSSGGAGDGSADDGSNADASGGSDARVDGDVALGCSVPAGPIGTCAVSAGGCQTQTLLGARTNLYDERAYGIATTPAEIVWIAQSPTENATATNAWGAGSLLMMPKGSPSSLPKTLVVDQYRATEIIVDGRTAYWVAATTDTPDSTTSMTLRSVSLDCAPTPCTPNNLSTLFDVNDSVVRLVHPSTSTFVFVDASGTSYLATQTAPTGFSVTPNPVSPLSPPPSLAAIPPKAWFGSATSDTLSSYDVATQQVSILPTGLTPQALVTTCDGFYVASMPPTGGDSRVYRVELSGLASGALSAISDPSDLGVDADFVYVASLSGSVLERIARQNASPPPDVLSTKPIARIAVTDEGIYWGDNHYGGLYLTKKK